MIHEMIVCKNMKEAQRPRFGVPGPLGPGTPNQGLSDPLKDWTHKVGLQTQQRMHNNHSRLLLHSCCVSNPKMRSLKKRALWTLLFRDLIFRDLVMIWALFRVLDPKQGPDHSKDPNLRI
jgi:hypothetical protein